MRITVVLVLATLLVSSILEVRGESDV
eukprot:COSAG05_NODE_16582_length_342_cov_1.497942_1_plen_26_part_10